MLILATIWAFLYSIIHMILICCGVAGVIIWFCWHWCHNMFVQYEHHGINVWVRRILKGEHCQYCLCWSCCNLHPGRADNCQIAAQLYKLCVDFSVVTPVFECPCFEQNKSKS